MEKTLIYKTLVGSRAHKLHSVDSDYDYRGVFVVPTKEILSIGANPKTTSWIEGKVDDTQWEIGKFLFLATKCNPTILECFLAPVQTWTGYMELANDLKNLFPYVWNSVGVKNAFIGYGLNQRKKFLDNKDDKSNKFAVAYLRSLYNAWELLRTGTFSVDMSETDIYELLKHYKRGHYNVGGAINVCLQWELEVIQAFDNNPNKQTDFAVVNDFLLKVRKLFW